MGTIIIVQDTDENIPDVRTLALQMGALRYSHKNFDENLLDLIEQVRLVIALSCNNNINEEYSKHGFADYIKKPFDLDLLYKILRKHIPKQLVQ